MESETGRLLEEPLSLKQITWEIYDYYTLSSYFDYILKSPDFSFAGAKWYITMRLDKRANRNITLYLRRTNVSPLKQMVCCHLSISTIDGTTYGGSRELEDNSIGCYIELLPRSELDTKRDVIAPDGILRVLCKLHLERISVTASASSQTEMALMRTDSLSQDLEKLLLSGDESDVIIRVKGQEFRAHRGILGARSAVFASMFRVNMAEKSSGIVVIDDCEAAAFGNFLHFIYTGKLQPLTPEKAIGLYVLADKYDVAEVMSDCLEWIKDNLSNETLFDVITLALRHSNMELHQLAINFFCMNMKKIIKTVSWQRFMGKYPTVANELLNRALGDEDEGE